MRAEGDPPVQQRQWQRVAETEREKMTMMSSIRRRVAAMEVGSHADAGPSPWWPRSPLGCGRFRAIRCGVAERVRSSGPRAGCCRHLGAEGGPLLVPQGPEDETAGPLPVNVCRVWAADRIWNFAGGAGVDARLHCNVPPAALPPRQSWLWVHHILVRRFAALQPTDHIGRVWACQSASCSAGFLQSRQLC